MKTMNRSVALVLLTCVTSTLYGGEPARGVAGVDVILKQNPRDRAVTDSRGNFAMDALHAGSYTLTFRARKAEDLKSKSSTSDKFIVATSYSIKIDGAKRAVNKSGLMSDDLLAGYDVDVNLGAGARVRGQVAAGGTKKMVWISKEPGSNLPGRWVEEGSAEAKAAVHHNAHEVSVEALEQGGDSAGDVHRKGFFGKTDPARRHPIENARR
jgi:hypothetical protein